MRMRSRNSGSGTCAVLAMSLVACSQASPASKPAATYSWLGPQFAGAPSSGAGQSIAAGLSAMGCEAPNAFSFTKGPAPGSQAHLSCFYEDTDHVAASMEWIVESAAEADLVHVRLILSPDFCDNTYGANCIGWSSKMMMPGAKMGPGGMMMPAMAAHKFQDLVGSDHAEFKLSDADGKLVLHFNADYLSALASAPSGYASLGVRGGDGSMIQGDVSDIVAVSTSLDRNLNACHLSSYTVDSPPTDANYTPAPGAENWDYRVVYDVWVKAAAFGSAGFGDASVDYVHASPSKAGGPSVTVTKGDCPPGWKHYCADPKGCPERQCGDVPDEFCSDASVPPGPSDAGQSSSTNPI